MFSAHVASATRQDRTRGNPYLRVVLSLLLPRSPRPPEGSKSRSPNLDQYYSKVLLRNPLKGSTFRILPEVWAGIEGCFGHSSGRQLGHKPPRFSSSVKAKTQLIPPLKRFRVLDLGHPSSYPSSLVNYSLQPMFAATSLWSVCLLVINPRLVPEPQRLKPKPHKTQTRIKRLNPIKKIK